MAKNLRAIKKRIWSIKGTQQITKAMKMVAAARLKRAQDRAVGSRPYVNELSSIVNMVCSNVPMDKFALVGSRKEIKKVLILLYTSNRGLCGAFNSNLIRNAESLRRQLESEGKEVHFAHMGKKGHDYAKKRMLKICSFYSDIRDNVTDARARQISDELCRAYLLGEFDRIDVVYSKFHSAAINKPYSFTLIPVEPTTQEARLAKFEPDAITLTDRLLPELITGRIVNSMLETFASEHGARMTAMESATSNAGDLLRAMTLEYNKARQMMITQELVEITGSAEAQLK